MMQNCVWFCVTISGLVPLLNRVVDMSGNARYTHRLSAVCLVRYRSRGLGL